MMDFEWYRSRLSSDDFRSQWWAAVQLMNAGAEGEPHVQRLLELCERIVFNGEVSEREQTFVLYSARSSGRIIKAAGFEHSNSFHQRVAGWLIDLTHVSDLQIAAAGTWGMGDLGIPPESISERLKELACKDQRFDSSGNHSLRSVAYRMLVRIDRSVAATLVDSDACREYIADVQKWIAASRSRPPNHHDYEPELVAEAGWLLGVDQTLL